MALHIDDSEDLPYYPFYPRQFAKTVLGWPAIARGVYRDLLDMQWIHGRIPSDPELCRNMLNCTPEEWHIAWRFCQSKFPLNDRKTFRFNKKLGNIFELVLTDFKNKSKAGKASAIARNNKILVNSVHSTDANGDANTVRTTQTQTHTQSKNKTLKADSLREVVAGVFEHWIHVHGKARAKLDTKREQLIRGRLKEFGADALKASISGYKISPWHQGQNDRKKKFDDIELMMRDAKHVEAGIAFTENPQTKIAPEEWQ